MADKVRVAKVGQPDAKSVMIDARVARVLVSKGTMRYVTPPPAAPTAPKPSPAPVPDPDAPARTPLEETLTKVQPPETPEEEQQPEPTITKKKTARYARKDMRAEEEE